MDLDGDGDGRDTNDIAVFNASLNSTIGRTCGAIYNSDCEFNRDGQVNGADLTSANNWYGTNKCETCPVGTRVPFRGAPKANCFTPATL